MNRLRNMGSLDRLLRSIAGVVLVAVGLSAEVAPPWQMAALAIGAVLLITGAVGVCPGYMPFRIDTRRRQGRAA